MTIKKIVTVPAKTKPSVPKPAPITLPVEMPPQTQPGDGGLLSHNSQDQDSYASRCQRIAQAERSVRTQHAILEEQVVDDQRKLDLLTSAEDDLTEAIDATERARTTAQRSQADYQAAADTAVNPTMQAAAQEQARRATVKATEAAEHLTSLHAQQEAQRQHGQAERTAIAAHLADAREMLVDLDRRAEALGRQRAAVDREEFARRRAEVEREVQRLLSQKRQAQAAVQAADLELERYARGARRHVAEFGENAVYAVSALFPETPPSAVRVLEAFEQMIDALEDNDITVRDGGQRGSPTDLIAVISLSEGQLRGIFEGGNAAAGFLDQRRSLSEATRSAWWRLQRVRHQRASGVTPVAAVQPEATTGEDLDPEPDVPAEVAVSTGSAVQRARAAMRAGADSPPAAQPASLDQWRAQLAEPASPSILR